ncbi:MAG TPA: GDSL-type esterase/lipase family protein, partial [Adhaeribacter sp.]|nr:GDSL-type esterase/lipase family protein [Adhaeribacter sp.]
MRISASVKKMSGLLALFSGLWLSALGLPPDSVKKKTVSFRQQKVANGYKFIRQAQNQLSRSDTLTMRNFYRALDSLRAGTRKKVKVVHIGDSHIQADIFSGKVRQLLQADSAFGNGGRGMVFPYPLARTNNPWNYKVSYTGTWSGCRNIQASRDCPWGLAGITAETLESDATFSIRNNSVSATGFNLVRVFYPVQDPASFKVQLLADSLLYDPARTDPAGFVDFELPAEVNDLTIKLQKTSPFQEQFVLQGIYLDNDRPGLQYTSVGINGAAVVSFLRSPFLEPQLASLQPDLIIISLGTNDAYGKNFDPKVYFQNFGAFLQRLQRAAPQA